ncbi:hypothetical protein [Haloarchaeobius sp. TZWWS8]|uniref:hypothetical protein n=1 Tax=Haloarchaeobius sp. TZWWS8 TaxID=3446121 RepID=UPI003EB88AD7
MSPATIPLVQTADTGSNNGAILFDALAYSPLVATVAILATYLLLVVTSGVVVRAAFSHAGIEFGDDAERASQEDTGRSIGKLENVLVLTFMLMQAYTALGVIFAAKSIVRKSDMDAGDTSYYLTGTIANFAYSVVVGLALHVGLWLLVT